MSNSDKAENSKNSSHDSPFSFRERRPLGREQAPRGHGVPAATLRASRVQALLPGAFPTLAPFMLTALGDRISQPGN